jgi:hypothetical protein
VNRDSASGNRDSIDKGSNSSRSYRIGVKLERGEQRNGIVVYVELVLRAC